EDGQRAAIIRCVGGCPLHKRAGGNMKRLISLTGMLLITGIAHAGPKPATRVFSLSCPQVWEGAKAAVQSNYDVLALNDETRSGSFTTGSFWTGVRSLTFALRGASN